jgi:Flp pilus assembly CpaE family ATPase
MPVALEHVPSTPRLVVVAHGDPATADSLRHAVESAAGWQALVASPGDAGLAAALAAKPSVALVECAILADLPADCRTPLVAVGDDDCPADVRAAMLAGARSLLAWPDGAADLPGELARVAATAPDPDGGHSALVIAVRGVQGGAGTTTIATHLAAAWARWGPSPVLLVDLSGGLAFRLDLGAVPTWSSLLPPNDLTTTTMGSGAYGGYLDDLEPGVPLAAPNPECSLWPPAPSVPSDGVGEGGRLGGDGHWGQVRYLDPDEDLEAEPGLGPADHLALGGRPFPDDGRNPSRSPYPDDTDTLDPARFLESLSQPWAGLSVLPRWGLVDGSADPPPDPRHVYRVLDAAMTAYRVIVVDLPVAGGPAVEAVLSRADVLVAVGRCETAGVRGIQAAVGAWMVVGHDPDTVGAVVTGVRPRAPLAPREVRAALGDGLWALVPAAAAELAAAAEDGVLLLDRHDLPAVQAMVTLANRVVPFTAVAV